MGFVIEDGHYEESRKRLMQDPILRDMATDMAAMPLLDMAHQDLNGTFVPRFEFMQAANAEYARRGGTNQAHIGAVAEAILRILGADKY